MKIYLKNSWTHVVDDEVPSHALCGHLTTGGSLTEVTEVSCAECRTLIRSKHMLAKKHHRQHLKGHSRRKPKKPNPQKEMF